MNSTTDPHQKFKSLAFDINKMKNQLMLLLLEIYEKEIYKNHGCTTIHQYGFKYARLSKETVDLALRTLKNTQDTPLLRAKIATQGVYKVAMVAKLATPQTDKIYAEHVENMPKPVLFEFAKEMRNGGENCHAVAPKMIIELDEEMQVIFNQLKMRYGKDISNKEVLRVILKKLYDALVASHESCDRTNNSVERRGDVPGNGIEKLQPKLATQQKLPSRHIPTHKKREILSKTNGKCSYPNCTRPIENYHHTTPFAFNRSHEHVVGLCKIHHEFCHNGIIKNELQDPGNWKLNPKPEKSLFDSLYLKYKANAM